MAGSPAVVAHGAWPSPLSPARAAGGAPRFAGLVVSTAADGRRLTWWSEVSEGANVVYCSADGDVGGGAAGGAQPVRAVRSARSRVNEYGGGAFWAHGSTLYWVEDDDQRIRRLDEGGAPVVLTAEPPTPRAWRYAAGVVSPQGEWMVVERERHGEGPGPAPAEPINDLAWLATVPPESGEGPGQAVTLVRGADFCAAPALSPDGRHLAWLQWDHPDMPWDAAELWAAEMVVDLAARTATAHSARRVAGGRADAAAGALGRAVAACLPRWSPEGVLHFCDDRDDLWLLRSCGTPGLPAAGAGERAAALWAGVGEVGEPRWVSGGSRYGFLPDGTVLAAETVDGLDRLMVVDPAGASATTMSLPGVEPTWIDMLVADGDGAALVVGSSHRLTTVVSVHGDRVTELRSSEPGLPVASISAPEPITFPTAVPTAGSAVAHGLFHPPRLEGVAGPAGELPPLVVRIHGGPTAHCRAELTTSVQFWTTRGFAVVEVNHRGSTGFGRRYRDLLRGRWGVDEVADCIAAAEHLAATGRVDGRRCVIRGGSAGGFTALEAVCAAPTAGGFRFAAATSLYGVTDLMALAGDTHKFESRYLDGLVGPLPEAQATYRARSPLHHAERIASPVLVLQGLDDAVVPPAQAEVLVAAMEANGIPHEYRTYAGEGHGFRRPGTVTDALAAELAFYGRVLGFSPHSS